MADEDKKGLEGLLDRIADAAENLINLTIVTHVGRVDLRGTVEKPEVAFSGKHQSGGQASQPQEGKTFVTNVNLVDSDICSVIPPEYADVGESPVMAYHREQVERAMESMERKAELLVSVFGKVKRALDGGAAGDE